MRLIGRIDSERDARRFESYLITLGIKSQVDASTEGCQLWILDEDCVPRAREELAEFLKNRDHDRYREAEAPATAIRKEHAQAEKSFQRNFRDLRARWRQRSLARCPLTALLIA